MKLQIKQRAANKKSEVNKLRREGFIPAVLYVREKEGETIALNSSEFSAFLRQVKPGYLPTTVFTLVDETGKERRAIVKDIQYKITNYDVIHLDFQELVDDFQVNIKIPIEYVGVADCVGVKLGGVLRSVIRHVPVRCYPKDLPSFFELDVKELGLRESRRLTDIRIPETVRPLMNLNEVVAVIVKR
jgi:large subunit ribosomal protein L25